MFKPTSAKDRVNYGESLMPPAGYRLERAVGTTYSLDFETLTAIAISLGLIEDTDSELVNNPISMLNALQKVSDKIVIFCEAGQIKSPGKSNKLFLMLEKMIVPVTLPFNQKTHGYSAFHPKTWLLEYVNREGDRLYRFAIMSRNLTFDHSWDVSCALDGKITDSRDAKTKPIIDFLQFLMKQINGESANSENQSKTLQSLIQSIQMVHFDVDASLFSDFIFMPLGIGTGSYPMIKDPLFCDNFHDLVVVSPFISGSIIASLNDKQKNLQGTNRTLITRRTELSKISQKQAANFDVYVMKDDVVDGESSISEENGDGIDQESAKQDIHAKIFLRRKNSDVSLYLGSMNATYGAINSNVEMMLCLKTDNRILNGYKFLTDLMGEDRESKKNPFELVIPDKAAVEEPLTPKDKAEKIIKRICRLNMSASVSVTKDNRYDVTLNVLNEVPTELVMIRPLLSQKSSALLPQIVFHSLEVLQVSEFYVVSVTIDDYSLERVIMIPTAGIPGERDAEIIKSVIKDKKSFIEYIAFILGEDYIQAYLENKKASSYSGKWSTADDIPAVYEKMLRTSLNEPERLEEINYIMKIIKEDSIIPEEFRRMYKVFSDTVLAK